MDFIDIHTHSFAGSEKAIVNILPTEEAFSELKNRNLSIGLHPWYIDSDSYQKKLSMVLEMAKSPACLAIGETGLDRLVKTDFELQKNIFLSHIEIAEALNKPLIIHCVRAFDELLTMKQKTGSTVQWIVHGFNSKSRIAEKLLDEKIILSFGKHLKYPNSNAAMVLGGMSDNDFFLETDDNEISIQEVYGLAAKIRMISLEELKTIVYKNFKQIFNFQNG